MSEGPILRRRRADPKQPPQPQPEPQPEATTNSLSTGDKVAPRQNPGKMSTAMMPVLEINPPLKLR